MQVRISATIDPKLQHFAKHYSAQSGISLSRVLEEGLKLLEKKHLESRMAQGYLAEAEETEAFAAAALPVSVLAEGND